MKISEMSKERKAVTVMGDLLFWGGMFVGLTAPGVLSTGLLVGIEAVGVTIELLARCGFGKKAF